MADNNSKRFAPKLHIKKGDTVMVIAGSSKGTSGEVLEVFPSKNRAIVENAQMVTKHRKATADNPGGIDQMPSSIHISNLMLVDPKTKTPTRIGRKLVDGKLTRYAKKSGEIIR